MRKIHVIRIIGIAFLAIGLGLAFLHSYPEDYRYGKIIKELYGNFCAEFISIAITILLIDYLYELKEKESLKARLIRELGSEEKGFTSRALKEIKENGWLTDGSLKNSDLARANLSGLDLSNANLEGVNLQDADLSKTILKKVNFKNANLKNAKFLSANLESTILENTQAHGCNFYQAILVKTTIKNSDFIHSNMEQVELTESKIEGAKFEDLNFQFADFTRAEVINCNLLRADVNSSNIKNAKFERCDFNSIKNWQTFINRQSATFPGVINPPVGF